MGSDGMGVRDYGLEDGSKLTATVLSSHGCQKRESFFLCPFWAADPKGTMSYRTHGVICVCSSVRPPQEEPGGEPKSGSDQRASEPLRGSEGASLGLRGFKDTPGGLGGLIKHSRASAFQKTDGRADVWKLPPVSYRTSSPSGSSI